MLHSIGRIAVTQVQSLLLAPGYRPHCDASVYRVTGIIAHFSTRMIPYSIMNATGNITHPL